MNEKINDSEVVGEKPWPLIVMLAMVGIVLLAGFLLSPKNEAQKEFWLNLLGTTNQGIILNPPVDSSVLGLSAAGKSWAELADATWKLILVDEGNCEEACSARLQELVNMHTRLNRDGIYLQRAYINVNGGGLSQAELNQLYPETQKIEVDEAQFRQAFLNTNLANFDQPVVLMMNPIHVVQMYYTPEHATSGILADFEHLLELAH